MNKYLFMTFLLVSTTVSALHTPPGKGNIVHEDLLSQTVRFAISRNSSKPNVKSFCTGIFITADIILTAAHCLPKAGTSQDSFLFTNFSGDGYDSYWKVESENVMYVRHPKFAEGLGQAERFKKKGAHYDVGLIRLRSVKYSGRVATIYDSRIHSAIPRTSKYYVLGAGSKEYWFLAKNIDEKLMSKTTTGPLKGVPVQIEMDALTITMRTPSRYKVCKGDSGGPLVTNIGSRLFVTGVSSEVVFSPNFTKEGICGRNAISSKLSHEIIDWIHGHSAHYGSSFIEPED